MNQVCFVRGSRILTDRGEVPVERLNAGDQVVLATGGHAPIRWIGWRRLADAQLALNARLRPVLIVRDAFGPGAPHRDLRVSANHAIYVDGALIEAHALVNDLTIRWDHGARDVTYYHIELPAHGVLISEGLPTESYLDDGANRAFFANSPGPTAVMPRLPASAYAGTNCAPRHRDGQVVDALRERLRQRAWRLWFENDTPAEGIQARAVA